MYLFLDDVAEAYNLIKDLEPTTPQEYILKGVVNAALGQESGSVCILYLFCSIKEASNLSLFSSVRTYSLFLSATLHPLSLPPFFQAQIWKFLEHGF